MRKRRTARTYVHGQEEGTVAGERGEGTRRCGVKRDEIREEARARARERDGSLATSSNTIEVRA